jgi:hypothetical protein
MEKSTKMTDTNQKLVIKPWMLREFNFIKVIPCFHIDPQNVTTTTMIIEPKEKLKDTDRFISKEECLEIISTRVPGFDDDFFKSEYYLNIRNSDPHGITIVPKKNYVVYDNLVMKYTDFPGEINPILAGFDIHIRLKVKTNMHVSKVYPVDRNFNIFIRYFDPEKYDWVQNNEGFMETKGMIQTKIRPEPQTIIPTLTCRINANTEPDLHNTSDFYIFSSQPGYYCNLPLQELQAAKFFENDFNNIVVDPEVRTPLMEQIAARRTVEENEGIPDNFVK